MIIYPGSFNPFHSGHLDIALRAANLFGGVTLLVADNPSKQYQLSSTARKVMIQTIITEMGLDSEIYKVDILPKDKMLADYCKENLSFKIVKGLRNGSDLESEMSQEWYTHKIDSCIKTVYLTTKQDKMYLSSSSIRSLTRMTEKEFINYMMKINKFENLTDSENEFYFKLIYKKYKEM